MYHTINGIAETNKAIKRGRKKRLNLILELNEYINGIIKENSKILKYKLMI